MTETEPSFRNLLSEQDVAIENTGVLKSP